MIQIDDAGSGSLIGGTCIGAMRVETLEYYYDFIPITYYRSEAFRQKKYLNKCQEIVRDLVSLLNVSKEETILICQGYMFEKARKWLAESGYKVEKARIQNPLQERIENTFFSYALGLGVPVQYVKYTKYPLHFHRLLRWVYADYDNRVGLCKTGWKSWQKYGGIKAEFYCDKLLKISFVCLKCGKRIPDNSEVKVIKFFSNRFNYVYVHKKC